MSSGTSDLPSDVQFLLTEARSLVSELYDPGNAGNPAKVRQIQERLQTLQRSPHAWLIANDLLSSDITDLRFFGALTFTVKINLDWQNLGENDAQELLGRLIDHYVHIVSNGERPMVIRKLASSLAAIFLKPKPPWTRALLNLGASLAHGKYITEEQCRFIDLQKQVLPALSQRQLIALLLLSNTVAEEINRRSTYVDGNRVTENIQDALSIVEYALRLILDQVIRGQPLVDTVTGIEAIDSYRSWMCVREEIELQDTVPFVRISSVSNLVIQTLGVNSLCTTAARVITELLDCRKKIFSKEDLTLILEHIIGDFGQSHVTSLMDGDFGDENLTYLELLLNYSTLKRKELLIHSSNSPYEITLAPLLYTLFKVPGYAAVEDKASPLILEWWTEAADDLQDVFMDSPGQPELEHAKRNLAQVSMACFDKLMSPSPQDLQNWDDDGRAEFAAFRRDACDFLLAVYPMLGTELIHVLQERAVSSLQTEDWRTFETAAFCLAQLSEAIDENQHADDCLNSVFFSGAFARLCEGNTISITNQARQTLVDLLGRYTSYFERTHVLLPKALTFLFVSLDFPSCAAIASRSISHLCKSCRSALTAELPAFMSQFDNFRLKPTATMQTMERILEGIAAIIQTLSTDEEKAQYLERILGFLQSQAELARVEAERAMVENACVRGQMVLRCVGSVGRGLRTDGQIIIDSSESTDAFQLMFWTSGNGAATQSMIVRCLELLINDFPFDVSIVGAACDVLKAGYTEKTGPYVLPPVVTVNFVKTISARHPGTDIVMDTASAFLASNSSHPEQIREETVSLIIHVYEVLLWTHQRTDYYDPEVVNSGIDFLTRLLPKYHEVLFSLTSSPPSWTESQTEPDASASMGPPVLQTILNFTLLALQGSEPLPLRSASQFWVGLLLLPSSTSPELPNPVQNTIREFTPALCRILIIQIAGRCARSDIEHLCEVLRKLIFKHQGLARPHLASILDELAKEDPNLGQSSVASPAERERIVASLFAARGARSQTLQLAHSLWVKCRGARFDYTG